MDVDNQWKENFIGELDKTIDRGNVDTTTLELMKELLKGTRTRVSISEYFREQD
jgi:hypothetical protein